MSVVIRSVVGVLRPRITHVWMDAISDGEWPEDRRADVDSLLAVEQRLLAAGRRRKATGTGIDLNMSRAEEFELLVRLAPYSIHSEAWADSDEVFSSSDTGDHAWFALTPSDADQAAKPLAEAGYAFEEVLTFRQ